MKGFVRISVGKADPKYGEPSRWLERSMRFTASDLARLDRVLAGRPEPKPRLSRPLPADGSPPKGWSLR